MTGTKGHDRRLVAVVQQHAVHGSNKRRARRDHKKSKVKQTRSNCEHGSNCERYHKVLGRCAVVCNSEAVMAGIVMITTTA